MQEQNFLPADNSVELKNGLTILELEERLETAQLAAEMAVDSDRCDVDNLSII
jgi:hypothetical protein